MRGDFQRAKQQGFEFSPIARQRTEQPRVVRTIAPEASSRLLHGAFDNYRRAIIKRVREWRIGLNKCEPVLSERQRAEKWRSKRERHNSSTNIVHESGQGEFRRTHPTADGWLGFEDQHRLPGFCKRDGRREAVGPRTNDYGIDLAFRGRHGWLNRSPLWANALSH